MKENFFKKHYKFFCNAFIITSFFLSFFPFFSQSPAENTLSSIGIENRIWFFTWGITTSIGIFLNLKLLAKKLRFENKFFIIISSIGCFAVLVTVTIVGTHPIEVFLHWTSGMTFGILSYISIFLLFYLKDKRLSKNIFILILAAIIDVAFIFMYGLTALCEITILMVCEAVIFIENHTEKEPIILIESGENSITLSEENK